MIRNATTSDLNQVAELISDSFKATLLPYMIYTQRGIGEFLGAFIAHPGVATDRTLLVVVDADLVIAFAEFRRTDKRAALLSYVCVRSEYRGRGLASLLIRHYREHASDLQRIDLDVFADNEPAITLYHKLGFQASGKTMWFVRPLPTVISDADDLKIGNMPVAKAVFDRYGFCEIETEWRGEALKVGRIGDTVLRCFDSTSFADDVLLGSLRLAFPEAKEALLIAPSEPESGGRRICTSLRMTGVF